MAQTGWSSRLYPPLAKARTAGATPGTVSRIDRNHRSISEDYEEPAEGTEACIIGVVGF